MKEREREGGVRTLLVDVEHVEGLRELSVVACYLEHVRVESAQVEYKLCQSTQSQLHSHLERRGELENNLLT